jgi:HK97 family phage major capsid protein
VAITNATKTTDFSGFLTPELSAPIFEQARKVSVVQQLAKQVPMGPNGVSIPVTTGKLDAGWVAEGAQKPASSGSMNLVTLAPKKIATIAVVSEETVRANPGGYVTTLREQMGEAFAVAFDKAAAHGVSTPFSSYLDQTTKTVGLGSTNTAGGGVFGDLNAALRLLVNDGKKLTGFAFDTMVEPDLNGSLDTAGRPLFIDGNLTDVAPSVRGGTVLGRPTRMADGVASAVPGTTSTAYPVGYAGDWNQVVWGQVGGITYRTSNEATVTINGSLVSLWEHNLIAVLAEAEFAFYVHDTAAFVKLTKTTASS